MDTKQEWLQKLQHALACSLAQGLSQPHLNESIFHDLQSPPPSDLYPHLHQWYMNMSKKIKSSLQREQTFFAQSEQENIEDDSKIHGSEFKAKNLNLKITNELTKLLQQFKNQFIQKYDKISDKEFQLMSQKLIIIQIYILQNFELLLYRIADIYYAKKKIYAQNLQQVYSEMQAQILQTLNNFYKAPKQRFRALRLWIKQEFIDKVLNDHNYKDQIIKNFIIDLTQDQLLYTDYFQMPFDKIFHRIVVVRDQKYVRTIGMVLSRYKNYPSVQIIEQNQYITDKANYDNQGYSIYNMNEFFFCLQRQIVATDGKLLENQQTLLQQSLDKIILKMKEGTGNLILNPDCVFYRQQVRAYINNVQPSPFTNYVASMNAQRHWDGERNNQQVQIFSKSKWSRPKSKTISTIIGTTAEEVAKIHQLSPSLTTNEYIWKYEWTHMIATSLGGLYNYNNGFVGPSFFNRVMQRYQSWLVDINKDQIFDNHQLNDILYKVSITRANYTPRISLQKSKSCNFGVFAETVQIKIIAQYTIVEASPTGPKKVTATVPLLIHQFNPFLKIYPMRIQKQLFQECVKQLCLVQTNRRMLFSNFQSAKNLSSHTAEINQYYQYFKRRFFNEVRQYFKKNIQGQTLSITKDLSIRVKVISSQDNPTEVDQDEYYSVQILQLQSSLLEKLCGQNILLSSLTEKLNIDEISFNVNSNIIGFFVNIRSKQFDLPQEIASIVNTIFNFDKPILILQGGIYFKDNLLQNPLIPTYFQIKASLKESNKSQKDIEDLNYSFEDLSLTLAFKLKQKGGFQVDWSIGCQVNIYHLAKNSIKLSAFFRHYQGQNELQAKVTEHINELMGISWLSVEELELKINFTQKEITLRFSFDIQSVQLSMNASYSSKLISMKCTIQNLTINNALAVINKFIGTSLSVDLDLIFQNISLEIIMERVKKETIFNFNIQFKVESTIFYGYLHHDSISLQLKASADIIKFQILGQQFTLTKPTLSLITNEQFDQLKYTGSLAYQSKSHGLSANVQAIIGVQKNKKSKQNNYWLQADIKLDLEPTVTQLLDYLTAIDTIKLVYKSLNYIPIIKDESGKYLAIKTKYFTLFKKSVSLQVKLDFQKFILSASVYFEYDKNDKTSFLLLSKIGLSVALTALQIRLQADCVSPRLNNALFTGALIFGPGYVGGELTMAGIVNINNYIQFGFPSESGQKTILKLAYNNEAVDFQISAAIRIYDFYGAGHLKIVADALTYLQVTVLNLDFIKIVTSLINALRSQDKSNKKELISFSNDEANKVKLLVIDRLYFKYDIVKLNIEAQLQATIFDNQFALKASVSPNGISFFANMQKPIGIIDLISLSSATDQSKGPQLNIQLTQKQFKIEFDCKIQFGPISSATKIYIDSSLLSGSISINLFAIALKAKLTIDDSKKFYNFQVQFSPSQRLDTDNFVNKIINERSNNLKQQSATTDIAKQTRQNRRRFATNFKQDVKQSKKLYTKKQRLMEFLFGQNMKDQLRQLRAKNQIKIKQIQLKIRQKYQKMMEIKNYREYHKNNHQSFDINQIKKYIIQGEAIQLELQKEISNFRQQIKKLQNVDNRKDSQFLDLDRPMYKSSSIWEAFTSWVRSAYDTIKQFIKDVIDLLPRVTKFLIGAQLKSSGKKSEFKAYCNFTFIFMKKQHDIHIKWDGHFDQQIIEQKTIAEMTQLSLTYIRSVYMIPKPFIQRANLKNLEEIYIALDNGTLQGLNITYNPSLKNSDISYSSQFHIIYINIQGLYKNKWIINIYCNNLTRQIRSSFLMLHLKITKYAKNIFLDKFLQYLQKKNMVFLYNHCHSIKIQLFFDISIIISVPIALIQFFKCLEFIVSGLSSGRCVRFLRCGSMVDRIMFYTEVMQTIFA